MTQPLSLHKLSKELQQVELTGHPPLEQWQPEHSGIIDIVIKADGTWWHEGTLFRREKLVKLFAGILWQEDGEYYLKTPVEKLRIQVEDTPFFITALDVLDQGTEQQQLVFTSSYGDAIVADAEHKLWVEEDEQTAEPSPYLQVRYGMKGKLSRSVFYQLAGVMQQMPCPPDELPADHTGTAGANGDECLFAYSRGVRFLLGKLS